MKKFSLGYFSLWAGAALVGFAAIGYAEAVSAVQGFFFRAFDHHARELSALGPLLFVAATALVVWLAPEARGSGIPQVLEAIALPPLEPSLPGAKAIGLKKDRVRARALVSIRTAVIKVISSLTGLLGGASIGREGPTVQIAASIFAWVGARDRRLGLRTYLVAGGAAGVAAAFNTPIAGIAFALEEMAEEGFHHFKRDVMLAVIVAGITVQAVLGDYLYFGRLKEASTGLETVWMALFLGALCGGLGSVLAWFLSQRRLQWLPRTWWKRAFFCGVGCAILNYATDAKTAGSGYEAVRSFMDSKTDGLPLFLGPAKFVTLILSYLSGMAGGIFSPCLSVGAGLGFSVGKLAAFSDLKVAALLGMVAFFSGVVQAPLTAVIIVMEMTDAHFLVIPFLIASFLAQRIASIGMPIPVYRRLASQNRLD